MWNKVIGLEREKKLFQNAILNHHLASAYCFIGMDGIGKDAFALELAKVVNCQHPFIEQHSDGSQTIDACDHCKSCRMADNLSHPNIQYIFATPNPDKLTEVQYSSIKEQRTLKANDKYHRISIPNASSILISSIRNVTKNATMSATIGGHRFIIISNGDMMNTDAANAFLKTLEEPQTDTTIIITSSKKEKLLQTILSRCQQVFFNALSANDIARYLVGHYHKDEVEAKLIANVAQGSVTKAEDIFDDNVNEMRSMAVDMLRISLKRRKFRIEILTMIDKLLAAKDRKVYTQFLIMLLLWLRDVYTIAVTQNTDRVINTDLCERMVLFHRGYPSADLQKAIANIETAISMIEGNVDPKLTFLNLFINLRKVFL
jgi:DNA polymerase-3 subunit delta'